MPPTIYPKWADTLGKDVASLLPREERLRQEAIHELIRTEATHVQTLENLDKEFCQKMISGNLLPPDQVKAIFPNLPELITIHGSFLESLKEVQDKDPVISGVGDLLLPYFDGAAGEHLTLEAVTFCSNHVTAMTMIDARKQKDKKFRQFMKEAECDPSGAIIPLESLYISETQRITRYPLLLEMIIQWTEVGSPESQALHQSLERCRSIVQRVNTLLARIEDDRTLAEIQNHLDVTSLAKAKHPTAREFADLDLTKRRLVHQGTLTWKFSKGKAIDVHALLLEDILLLLQKKKNRFIVKCRKRGGLHTKSIFSPIIKLNNILARSVATDRNSFFVMDTSEIPQLLQLEASSVYARDKWIDVLQKAAMDKTPASASITSSTDTGLQAESSVNVEEESVTDPADVVLTTDNEHPQAEPRDASSLNEEEECVTLAVTDPVDVVPTADNELPQADPRDSSSLNEEDESVNPAVTDAEDVVPTADNEHPQVDPPDASSLNEEEECVTLAVTDPVDVVPTADNELPQADPRDSSSLNEEDESVNPAVTDAEDVVPTADNEHPQVDPPDASSLNEEEECVTLAVTDPVDVVPTADNELPQADPRDSSSLNEEDESVNPAVTDAEDVILMVDRSSNLWMYVEVSVLRELGWRIMMESHDF